MPLYERLDKLNIPAVFHTGYLMVGLFEKDGKFGQKPSLLDITNMRPAAIDRIVRGFPNLKILMAHFGNPWWEEAWKMISAHKNVYADLSGGTAYKRSLSMWRDIFAPNGELDTSSVEKLCFGTDCTYFTNNENRIEGFIQFYDRLYMSIGIQCEIRNKIDYGNIRELFGESK